MNPQDGIRLSKRVAAAQACSRREAEALIFAGAVQVDGQTVTDPAHRVSEQARLQISPTAPVANLTVLLHKPAGVAAQIALGQAWGALGLGPSPPMDLRECLPLPVQACGLSVWSSESPVLRRLGDRVQPLECEWLLALPTVAAPAVVAALRAAGVRASLGHEREGQSQWRLIDKTDRPWAWPAGLPHMPTDGTWTVRRQRIGRLGLSPLASGQARVRPLFEKF